MTRDFVADTLAYCVNRRVRTFDNGHDAWSFIDGARGVDIVFTDISVPDLDGRKLLTRIKRHYPGCVCVMTSYSGEDEAIAENFGADAFLGKPFEIKDIFHLVQTFVVEGKRVKSRTED